MFPLDSAIRSATHHQLVVQRYRLSTYDRRAFSVAGRSLWNSLPVELRDPTYSAVPAQA